MVLQSVVSGLLAESPAHVTCLVTLVRLQDFIGEGIWN